MVRNLFWNVTEQMTCLNGITNTILLHVELG